MGNSRWNHRFPLYAMVLVFAFPIVAAWILFYFHDFFARGTVNHGTLISPLVQTAADSKHRWQVTYVPGNTCDKECVKIEQNLMQMLKLFGQNHRRVVSVVRPALEGLPAGRVYLVDPLGNIFMYYASSMNPVDIYRDLKHLLSISQIG